MNLGFAGLGQMGRPMAGRLIEAGHALTVYNRTRAAAEPLEKRGARIAAAPEELAAAEIVVTMLADDAAVEAVWVSSGLAQRLRPGSIHINMATVSLAASRKLSSLHERHGSAYVAAPVFGRPAAAEQGQLDVIAAGPAAALERCQPLFKAMAKQVFVVGAEPEKANAVKIARNFLLATIIESLGEAMALARKCGVDGESFLHILTSTAIGARYAGYGGLMTKEAWRPAQFSMALGLKDIELALATAAEAGAWLPSAEMIRDHIREAIRAGRGDEDAVALAGFIAGKSGL
ncbi:MAG TPA: NAD(P)-dependent oxidoreductase [Burkholderiales bacterium]|jgi:3-hydroxyisobutyrate dehydrogenase-like beta-hydroxyacid dehydrogenase|nr:NAD(P)-dependent oxidoreductase [Burkholderiales bacterium]